MYPSQGYVSALKKKYTKFKPQCSLVANLNVNMHMLILCLSGITAVNRNLSGKIKMNLTTVTALQIQQRGTMKI